MKKLLLVIIGFVLTNCSHTSWDGLDIVNGEQYVVSAKFSEDDGYLYHLIRIKNSPSFYTYGYRDTISFQVGDTIIVKVELMNKK